MVVQSEVSTDWYSPMMVSDEEQYLNCLSIFGTDVSLVGVTPNMPFSLQHQYHAYESCVRRMSHSTLLRI